MFPRLSTSYEFVSVGDPKHGRRTHEAERRAALCDGAEQAVHSAHNIIEDIGYVVECVDEQWVKVEGLKDAIHDFDKVAESNDQFQLGFNVGNGQIDLLDPDLHAGVDLDQICDLRVKVDVGLKVFHVCAAVSA